MDSRFASFSFLFHLLLLLLLLLLLQCIHTNSKKVYDLQQAAMDNHLRAFTKQGNNHDHPSFAMDASLNVFFTINDLKVGKRKPIYFAMKNPSLSPRLLPREEADSIPFSLSHLQELLDFFSFSDESPQAKAMEYTLGECEMEPMRGERKFCATSLESMLDSARGVFGLDAEIKVLTTRLRHRSSGGVGLQNYTVLKAPEEISTPRMVACHPMPYPYAVFYCHGQESDHRLFRVSLGGDGGERVEALVVCHMDTSQWDPNHAAFRVLKTRPGRSPVCHFFPADNLVWAESPTVTQLVG